MIIENLNATDSKKSYFLCMNLKQYAHVYVVYFSYCILFTKFHQYYFITYFLKKIY